MRVLGWEGARWNEDIRRRREGSCHMRLNVCLAFIASLSTLATNKKPATSYTLPRAQDQTSNIKISSQLCRAFRYRIGQHNARETFPTTVDLDNPTFHLDDRRRPDISSMQSSSSWTTRSRGIHFYTKNLLFFLFVFPHVYVVTCTSQKDSKGP